MVEAQRFQVIGIFIGSGRGGETIVDMVSGTDPAILTARVIEQRSRGNDYCYVCTLNSLGQLVMRADRDMVPREQVPSHMLQDKITIVAFHLEANEAYVFETHAIEDRAKHAADVTLSFIENNQDVAVQFVCTIDGTGQVIYTSENLPQG